MPIRVPTLTLTVRNSSAVTASLPMRVSTSTGGFGARFSLSRPKDFSIFWKDAFSSGVSFSACGCVLSGGGCVLSGGGCAPGGGDCAPGGGGCVFGDGR